MNSTLPADKPKNSLKAIFILCIGIISGCVLFAVMMIVVRVTNLKPIVVIDKKYENILLGINAVAAIVCLFFARKNYNKAITNAKDSLISLPDKLNSYKNALTIYMALCEFPALAGIVIFFLCGNYLFLLVTGFMVIVMLVKLPVTSRVAAELELGSQERQELE